MGTSRLYLSPLNLGPQAIGEIGLGGYTVEWIRVKVLSITLDKTSISMVNETVNMTPDYQSNESGIPLTNTISDSWLTATGATYTIGYLSASELASKRIQDSETVSGTSFVNDIGNSFSKTVTLKSDGNVQKTFYGNGFVTQKTSGKTPLDYQYEGPYAATMHKAMTYRLGESAEILIRNPKPYALELIETTPAVSGVPPANEYDYANQYEYVPTESETVSFLTKQAPLLTTTDPISVTGAKTPIYGLVQIDLPEDLIQTVYQNVVPHGISVIERMGAEEASTYMRQLEYINSVLNANFNIEVEYGFSSA